MAACTPSPTREATGCRRGATTSPESKISGDQDEIPKSNEVQQHQQPHTEELLGSGKKEQRERSETICGISDKPPERSSGSQTNNQAQGKWKPRQQRGCEKKKRREQKNINIATINVRGLKKRQKRKLDAVCIFLREQEIDVCVITETHLNLHSKGYGVKAKSCRKDASAGGALILVSTDLDSDEVRGLPTFPLLLSVCSVVIYPHESEGSGIRITGLYFPPSADMRADDIQELTDP